MAGEGVQTAMEGTDDTTKPIGIAHGIEIGGHDHRTQRRRRRKRRADSDADTGSDSGSGRERQRTRKRGDIPETTRRRGPLPDQADSFALVQQGGDGDAAAVRPPKEKANYGTTGALAAASNAVTAADGQTVTLKYHEPPEARKPAPADAWRLFVFKDGAIVDSIVLAARSCWLVGREAAVVDLLAAHPSVSKQHAVLQFRFVERRNEFGDRIGRVRPYVLDLASANGTRLNGEAVAAQRFVELRERDMVQFGDSTREYVLMKEG
ncbi:fha domain containing protein [Grosmannia clavigera kw1407]|uniref:Fha domain containing protein n=1 Tax=Grosmannia clavigera (strain kw1407 / UAMH 11150) TaxID=655863 RepID=F0XEH9_GROCL|nr:fha domain containing protein [Grosmannia clavigera kw1407]EFX04079.1 fha domain containing protein [Grosmannia clavigera kw1407]